MQENEVAVSLFYRGFDPRADLPSSYSLFYGDGRPKLIALAFSLWSKITAYPHLLRISCSPSTPLRLLAGRNDHGEIAVLIANPTENLFRYQLDEMENAPWEVFQVNDASQDMQIHEFKENILEIPGQTVQFVHRAK